MIKGQDGDEDYLSKLSSALSTIHDRKFRRLLPAEQILAERMLLRSSAPDRRLDGLIGKLPNLGNQAAPRLVELIIQNMRDELADWLNEKASGYSARRQKRSRLDKASALLRALCKVGPNASKQLPKLRAFETEIDWNGGYPLYRDWHRALLSLGEERHLITAPSAGAETTSLIVQL